MPFINPLTKTNNDANIQRSLVGTPWYMAPEIINEEAYSLKVYISMKITLTYLF